MYLVISFCSFRCPDSKLETKIAKNIYFISTATAAVIIFSVYWSSTSKAKLKDCVKVLNLGRL
jgi:hypothetical protein